MAIFDIFSRVREQKGFAQDVTALQRFQQQQQLALNFPQLAQGQVGPNVPIAPQFPRPQSQAGAELFSNFLLQRQQIGGRLTEAQAQPPTKTQLQARRILELQAKKRAGVITEPERASLTTLLEGAAQVQVFTGDIAKTTAAKIEQDVIDLQGTLTELRAIEQQFDPDFFTFRGKGKAFFTELAEKAEIPVGKAAQTFLRNRTKFFADSKRVFLKFRKFITGVAGGIEEFREIAKATIDPEKDSPTQFKAKFESMRDNAIRTSNLLLAIRNSGLEPSKTNIKSVLSITPLGDIPLRVSPNSTLETLGIQQPNKFLIRPFGTDDVPTAVSPRTGETIIFKNGRWQPKRQ